MNPNLSARRGWLVSVLILTLAVTCVRGQNATHVYPGYSSPGTITITNTFTYPSGPTLVQFVWVPQVPAGWTITNVRGDGNPYMDSFGYIGFAAFSLPNPLVFLYDVVIPSGESGDQEIVADVYYDLGPGLEVTQATSNPLVLKQFARAQGYVFHEETADGVRNPGTDTPVTNITVFLLSAGTTNRLAETRTDTNGYYTFSSLLPGGYDIEYWVNTNALTLAPGGTNPERNRLATNSGRIIAVTLAGGDGYQTGAEPINVGLTGGGNVPLSSELGLRLYRGAEGIILEFGSRNEVMANVWLVAYRLTSDGKRVELGRTPSLGSDSVYRLSVPEGLLDAHGPNTIVIVDETGAEHRLEGVRISNFAAERLTMTKQGMELTWRSLPGCVYDIYKTTELGGRWQPVVVNICTTGTTGQAIVPVNRDEPRAFFKIVMRESE